MTETKAHYVVPSNKQTEQTRIQDKSNDRSYFTIIPRLVWAKARSPFDVLLWYAVKSIAGENGECYLGTRDLAIVAMMSITQVVRCRRYLIDQGLLEGKIRRNPNHHQAVFHLRIPDIWEENLKYSKENASLKERIASKRSQMRAIKKTKPRSVPVGNTNQSVPGRNTSVPPVEHQCTSGSTEEEPGRRTKKEEPAFSSEQTEEVIEHAREVRADEYKTGILAILDPNRSDEERKDHKAAHKDRIAKAISSFDPDAVNWAVPARAGGGDQLGEAMLDAWIVSKMLDKSALTEKIRNGWRNHLVKLATQDGLNLTIGTAVGSVVRVLAPNGPGTGWVGHTSPYQRKFEEDFLDAALSANKESDIKTPVGGVQHVKTPSSGVQHVKV